MWDGFSSFFFPFCISQMRFCDLVDSEVGLDRRVKLDGG